MTEETKSYLSLKLATARKTGLRATGDITYRVLCDEERQALFVTIVSNDGGGYFSREIVPFAGIEKCVASYLDGKPLPARMLRDTFVGRSVNNAGFLAAMRQVLPAGDTATAATNRYASPCRRRTGSARFPRIFMNGRRHPEERGVPVFDR